MRALISTIMVAAVCSLFVGCADSATPPAGAAEIINTHCPIMGGKINPETTVDYDGKKVAFCCPPCVDEWAAMSEDEQKKALQEAAAGQGHADHEDHEGHSGESTTSDEGEHAGHGDADEPSGSTEDSAATPPETEEQGVSDETAPE